MEAHCVLTGHTRGGINAWPQVTNLKRAKDDAQRAYQYARKKRRAVHRGKNASVIRNVKRAAVGNSLFPCCANTEAHSAKVDPIRLLNNAGDLIARQLRDVSPNKSDIDSDPDCR